jgi:hypothetical protein
MIDISFDLEDDQATKESRKLAGVKRIMRNSCKDYPEIMRY